jgi:hypothetical protein
LYYNTLAVSVGPKEYLCTSLETADGRRNLNLAGKKIWELGKEGKDDVSEEYRGCDNQSFSSVDGHVDSDLACQAIARTS